MLGLNKNKTSSPLDNCAKFVKEFKTKKIKKSGKRKKESNLKSERKDSTADALNDTSISHKIHTEFEAKKYIPVIKANKKAKVAKIAGANEED